MLSVERVSELQDMVLKGEDVNMEELTPEEQQVVNNNQIRLESFVEGLFKIFISQTQ